MYMGVRAAGPVEVLPYSTAAVLGGSWDIIHVYWPEWLVRRDCHTFWTAIDGARMLAELRLAKSRGAKIVWTANNIRPHELGRSGVILGFIRRFSRLVDQVISPSYTALGQFRFEYPAIDGVDLRVITQGSYRGVYPDDEPSRQAARDHLNLPAKARIALAFGMVRPYKNIPELLRCHREVTHGREDAFLLVAGKPASAELARQVRQECDRTPRARADLRFVRDAEIQYYVRASDSLVLGTSFAVNSASAFLGLSFDRPVLMPHRGAAVDLVDEVGGAWVHTYEGGMRPSVLARAFDIQQPAGRPRLPTWADAGRRLYDAYCSLVVPPAGRKEDR
ncbi:hypothetical protein [Nonomuraea sp. SBT364]|uniref:hypothetical protein n=1 Tax=Nonomuraea sp. SBT364 TaxID=1580530 RepID=UPI00066C14CC|nr:hypothetical protein [Nonomuraea sp. SBT364]